jgi:hypothetical protein
MLGISGSTVGASPPHPPRILRVLLLALRRLVLGRFARGRLLLARFVDPKKEEKDRIIFI